MVVCPQRGSPKHYNPSYRDPQTRTPELGELTHIVLKYALNPKPKPLEVWRRLCRCSPQPSSVRWSFMPLSVRPPHFALAFRGFREEGLGIRVQGLGIRVWGIGFRHQGLGIRVQKEPQDWRIKWISRWRTTWKLLVSIQG